MTSFLKSRSVFCRSHQLPVTLWLEILDSSIPVLTRPENCFLTFYENARGQIPPLPLQMTKGREGFSNQSVIEAPVLYFCTVTINWHTNWLVS